MSNFFNFYTHIHVHAYLKYLIHFEQCIYQSGILVNIRLFF